jgi:hypothetical protein
MALSKIKAYDAGFIERTAVPLRTNSTTSDSLLTVCIERHLRFSPRDGRANWGLSC